MNKLQKMFSSLALFSDLDWAIVSAEYESEHADLSFPEYLQQKAIDGDCPEYLFELAFYEQVRHELMTMVYKNPPGKGFHLNPTAAFLSLEFDVKDMLEDAAKGEINIHEEANVLALFKNPQNELVELKMTEEDLDLLSLLEDGPLSDLNIVEAEALLKAQLIIHT